MARVRYPPGTTHTIVVKRELYGKPLSRYLATRLSIPTAWLVRLIEAGHVRFEGEVHTSDTPPVFKPPATFTVFLPQCWPDYMAPTEMPLSILYEDEHLIALDKPPGIVVHPARGHLSANTLQNGVLHRYRDQIGHPGVTIGPAHRIDRDTSGIVIYSRTRDAYRSLTAQFAGHIVHKEYYAIAQGSPDFETTTIDAPLTEDDRSFSRARVASVEEGGRPASTFFQVLEKGNGWAILHAKPKTGRGHQVRVHAATLGLPLVADADYNSGADGWGLTRQALHAWKVKLTHPISGEELSLCAPVPEDMASLRQRLIANAF